MPTLEIDGHSVTVADGENLSYFDLKKSERVGPIKAR